MKHCAILLFVVSVPFWSCSGSRDGSPDCVDALSDERGTGEPELVIEGPSPMDLVGHSPVLLQGRLQPPTAAVIEVGGRQQEAPEGHFSIWLPIADGENRVTITATLEDGRTVTREHLFSADLLPPALTILEPPAGALLESPQSVAVEVWAMDENGLHGPVTVASMLQEVPVEETVGGEEADGVRSFLVELPVGVQVLQAEAQDASGHVARYHRPVFVGPGEPCLPQAGIPDMCWDVGNAALSEGALFVTQMMAELDFSPYLVEANPVFDESGITVQLESLELVDPGLFPGVENGQLKIAGTVETLIVSGSFTLEGIPEPYAFQGLISKLEFSCWVVAKFIDGAIAVQFNDFVLAADQVTLAVWNGAGDEVIAPTAVEGAFLDFVTSALSDALLAWANEAMDELQELLSGTVEFEFLGQPLSVGYELIGLDILQTRLRLSMQAEITIPGLDPDDGCALRTIQPPPGTYEDQYDVSAWFALDFMNRLLRLVWRAGMLELTVDQAMVDSAKLELELVAGLLGDHLRAATGNTLAEAPIELDLEVVCPPESQPFVVGQGNSPAGAGLVLAGVRLSPRLVEAADESPLATIDLSLAAALHAEIHENLLTLSPAAPAFALDITSLASDDEEFWKRLIELEVETHFEALLPEALSALGGALLTIPLPSFYGVDIVKGELASQSDPGYVRISGSLRTGGKP